LSTAGELRALEERLLQSDFRRNRNAVSELLADDFREFGSSGRVWNKQEILDLLETEPAFQATLQDFHAIELASSGVCLVTYTASVQRAGAPGTLTLRSSIWIMREGRWQIIFHQGTRIAQP
jgi:hypothetical protein